MSEPGEEDSTGVDPEVLDELREEAELRAAEIAETEEADYLQSIQHDYDNPTRAAEYDFIQQTAPPVAANPETPPEGGGNTFRFKWAQDIVQEEVPWIWRNRIPQGALTILDGDPGVGKTTIILDLMSRLSSGRPMPFEDTPLPIGNSLVVSVEDSVAYTLAPRLAAGGAQMDRVALVIDYPSFPSGLGRLERTVRQTRARLILVDPGLAMFDPNVNTGIDAETRRVVSGLAAVAADTESAIVFIRHLTKAQVDQAMYRGGGSIAIAAAARSCLLAKVPRGKQREPVLAVYKANLCPVPPTIRYRVGGAEQSVGTIQWLEQVALTANEALAGDLPQKGGFSEVSGSETSDFKQLGKESRHDAAVYSTLLLNPAGCTVAEIVKQAGINQKQATPALERLMDAGKVERAVVKTGSVGRPSYLFRAVQADEPPQNEDFMPEEI